MDAFIAATSLVTAKRKRFESGALGGGSSGRNEAGEGGALDERSFCFVVEGSVTLGLGSLGTVFFEDIAFDRERGRANALGPAAVLSLV